MSLNLNTFGLYLKKRLKLMKEYRKNVMKGKEQYRKAIRYTELFLQYSD